MQIHGAESSGAALSDWMKSSADSIRDFSLCQLPLPGSHDAGSYGEIRARSRTQELTISQQLNAGVRFFDFRVIVDGLTYFSHHGLDHSRDNIYTIDPPETGNSTLFKEIRNFSEDHNGEILILCFNDFWRYRGPGLVDGYATAEQVREFKNLIRIHFGSMLIPSSGLIPKYGDCINNKKRILVIFDNDEIDDPMIWKKKNCLRERFSAYNSATARSWEALADLTISDQEEYLVDSKDANKRSSDCFWVSQAVLEYKNELGTTDDNKLKIENSRNYAGAERMNPRIIEAYKHWWAGQSASAKQHAVQKPNILLLDFSGTFECFAADCVNLVRSQG
jgi:hypothetical protein